MLRKTNWLLVIFPLMLFSLGFVTLYSSSPRMAFSHLTFTILGLIAFIFVSSINLEFIGDAYKFLYGITMALLAYVYFMGHTVYGSSRWIKIGSLTFQPSELAKVTTIICLSYLISKEYEHLNKPLTLLKLSLLIAPLFILVLIEPDLGTSLVMIFVFILILFMNRLSLYYFALAFIALGMLSNPLWNTLHDYQKGRVLILLNPQLDKLNSGYQINQSLIAIGSGGIFGKGFSQGSQASLNFLPSYWNDFIFASFVEEWGIIGGLCLILVFILLLSVIYYSALKQKEIYQRSVIFGVWGVFLFQFLVNVGMNLGVAPVTGITLPFVSSGGTSVLISFILLGLVNSTWIYSRDNL